MQKPKAVELTMPAKAEKRSRRDAGGGYRCELAELHVKRGLAEAEAQRALNDVSTYF